MVTVNKTDPFSSVRSKLKSSDPEIQNYVAAMEKENLRLNKLVAKFQVENMSLNNRVHALIAENEQSGANFFTRIVEAADPMKDSHDNLQNNKK